MQGAFKYQAPWHFLNFLLLPHGQGSLRPTSLSSLRTGSWGGVAAMRAMHVTVVVMGVIMMIVIVIVVAVGAMNVGLLGHYLITLE